MTATAPFLVKNGASDLSGPALKPPIERQKLSAKNWKIKRYSHLRTKTYSRSSSTVRETVTGASPLSQSKHGSRLRHGSTWLDGFDWCSTPMSGMAHDFDWRSSAGTTLRGRHVQGSSPRHPFYRATAVPSQKELILLAKWLKGVTD